MLHLINTYSGGGSHRCPLAFAAAAPQCRIVNEMIGAGFSTRHYSCQLVQRSECERVDMDRERLFADETVPRAHIINVTDADDEGSVPASLVASCWWFARRHPQHVPISLLLTGKSFSSLEALRRLDFAHRVEVLYIAEPTTSAGPDYLSPLATFTNVRKVCEFSPCGDVRWMLSCQQLAYVDVMGYNRPADWNAAEVFPKLLALTELILYEGGVGCLTWLPKCTKLTKLTLDGCPWVEDCNTFSTMPNLAFLRFVFDKLKDISGLAACSKLTTLELGGTPELTDASVIGALTNLEHLNISHTGITDIGWIKNCGVLEELFLFNVKVQRGFDVLVELRHLRSITLIDVPQFSFEWVSPHCNHIEEVVVERCDVLSGVEHLRNARMLRKLTLTAIGDGDGAWLGDCIMLEELEVSCPANDSQTIDTVFLLPRLRVLKLSLSGDNQENGSETGSEGDSESDSSESDVVADVIRTHYSASLEKLTVFGTNVHELDATDLLNCIRHCTKLHSLSLRGVPLHDTSGAWLNGLTSLQSLVIGDCEASAAALDAIGSLTVLRELTLNGIRGWAGFAGEWLCGQLKTLSIRSCNDITDLRALQTGVPMRYLTDVTLADVPLTDLSCLENAAFIREISIHSLSQLDSLAGLASCQSLQIFTLDDCACVTSLAGLHHCGASLMECQIFKCDALVDLDALAALAALTDVRLRQLPKVVKLSLASAEHLRQLSVIKCAALTSLEMPLANTRLKQLTMQKCPLLSSFSSLDHCTQLEQLSLADNTQLETLPTLSGCAHLSTVSLSNLKNLRDISGLLACSESLHRLSVTACKRVTNMEVVAQLPRLSSLDLSTLALADLSWIGQCTSLTYLGLSSCTGTAEYSAIATLTQLKSLYISSCPLEDISWASQMTSPPIEEFEVRECPKLKVSDAASLPRFVQLR